MFAGGVGGGLWGGLAPPTENLLEKERPAPPQPTTLEFPNYSPPRAAHALTRHHMSSLRKTLISIRRPTDVQDQHLAPLSIHLENDVPISSFVPKGQFEQRPFLYDRDLTSMLAELEFDNQDAFREVLRMPPLEGRKKPRLAYARNFYASLEDMSRYWDASADRYFYVDSHEVSGKTASVADTQPEVKESDDEHANERKIADARESTTQVDSSRHTTESPRPQQPIQSPSSNSISTPVIEPSATSQEKGPSASAKLMYTGHRLGAGHQMSPGTRIAAVRNLLKMVIYKFNCRDYDLSQRERLRVKDINVPPGVFMCHFTVMRIPQDTKLARARMLEGPVLGTCCRPEVQWRERTGRGKIAGAGTPTGEGEFVGEKFDLLREVGSMLLLAMQRGREGRSRDGKDTRQADDSWWTSRPRWGGGPTKWGQLASEVLEEDDPSWSPLERRLQMEKRARGEEERNKLAGEVLKPEVIDIDDLIASSGNGSGSERPPKKKNRRAQEGMEQSQQDGRIEMHDGKRVVYMTPQRKRWHQDWAKLRPNASTWDDKVIYKRIGRAGEFDEVFQVSSVNHHVCLMRMRVHPKYVEWLEKGGDVDSVEPELDGGEQSERVLRVSRSAWFDLFDIGQRQDFLTALWRLMCWINRDEIPKAEFEKMEEARKRIQVEDDGNKMDTGN